MRAQLSEQDLTDYALNELGDEQRLYVESMLAVSEECRHDVCAMIDLAMLIDQGFEREATALPGELTTEQREKLISFKPRSRVLETATAVFAAAAAVALVISHPALWHVPAGAQQVARVSSQVSNYVVEAVTPDEGVDFVGQLANWPQFADDPVLKKFFTSEWFSGDRGLQSSTLGVAASWDSIPLPAFEKMP